MFLTERNNIFNIGTSFIRNEHIETFIFYQIGTHRKKLRKKWDIVQEQYFIQMGISLSRKET